MPKFYFTYGTEGQPFFGGWTEVEATDSKAACAVFRVFHPDKTEGLLNCSSVYDEEQFKMTEMYQRSNFGYYCHETIVLRHETVYGAGGDPKRLFRENITLQRELHNN